MTLFPFCLVRAMVATHVLLCAKKSTCHPWPMNQPRPAQGLPHEFCESCIALKHGDKTLKSILPQLVVPGWCWGEDLSGFSCQETLYQQTACHNDTMHIELYYAVSTIPQRSLRNKPVRNFIILYRFLNFEQQQARKRNQNSRKEESLMVYLIVVVLSLIHRPYARKNKNSENITSELYEVNHT